MQYFRSLETVNGKLIYWAVEGNTVWEHLDAIDKWAEIHMLDFLYYTAQLGVTGCYYDRNPICPENTADPCGRGSLCNQHREWDITLYDVARIMANRNSDGVHVPVPDVRVGTRPKE